MQAAAISWEKRWEWDRAAGPVLSNHRPSRFPSLMQMPTAFAHHSQRRGPAAHPAPGLKTSSSGSVPKPSQLLVTLFLLA